MEEEGVWETCILDAAFEINIEYRSSNSKEG
jgi:hypothetical protein